MRLNFLNFMLVFLGIIGISLILLSIFTTFILRDNRMIFLIIGLLGFATGILYLCFIIIIVKFFKKQNF